MMNFNVLKCYKYVFFYKKKLKNVYLLFCKVAIKYSFYERYTDMIFKGRSMFKPGENVDLGGGILLFSGIFQSVRINALRVYF